MGNHPSKAFQEAPPPQVTRAPMLVRLGSLLNWLALYPKEANALDFMGQHLEYCSIGPRL